MLAVARLLPRKIRNTLLKSTSYVMGKISSSGITSIRCLGCKNITVIQPKEFNFSVVSVSEELMGTQTCHRTAVSKPCKKCGKALQVTYSVWEYPEDTFHGTDVWAENAVVIGKTGFRVTNDESVKLAI